MDKGMWSGKDGELEYYFSPAEGSDAGKYPPIIFIHGILSSGKLFTHHMMPLLSSWGFTVYSLSMRGHGQSHCGYSNVPFRDHVEDVAGFIQYVYQQENQPVVVAGYSLGGLVVQHASGQPEIGSDTLKGMLLLASVPPKGFHHLTQTLWLGNPQLSMVLGQVMAMPKLALLNPLYQSVLASALFAGTPEPAQLDALLSDVVGEDLRLFIDSSAVTEPSPLATAVIGAMQDKLVPESEVRATAAFYGVEPKFFDPMGHAIPVEDNVVPVCEYIRDWLVALSKS
ncbi:hypothetical protein ABT56_00125 [Photobacterium aquae]|uniref:AB hydrolase-1 domain-containing protein n=1 Tax=Photobacterium aquae TaxID=1195763 RepID=A0A0J1HCW8_9GAMM|nr:alpha/beta fold hydrolase [Photobacterium aquae]KLV09539.1 hypothetical protein ABT56_00125 [Photobacterium aquae]